MGVVAVALMFRVKVVSCLVYEVSPIESTTLSDAFRHVSRVVEIMRSPPGSATSWAICCAPRFMEKRREREMKVCLMLYLFTLEAANNLIYK